MSTSILYFLPTTSADTSPLPNLINRLATHYEPSILPRWSLRQRLFRSTPAPRPVDDNIPPTPARHLQILSLPDHPNDSLIVITPTTDATADPAPSVISLPAGQSTDDFIQLLVTRLGPLWQQRQLLAVVDGLAYDIGEFRVRAGELRQSVGGAQLTRGVIVELTHLGEGGAAHDGSEKEENITAFWDELGVKGAREFKGSRGEKGEDGFGDVRLWSLVLLLKG
ncbi:MAG: hypothetical protein Q9221_002052 [Calogaya cf. arnoldii]